MLTSIAEADLFDMSRIAYVCLIVVLISGCSPDDPTAQLRQVIDAAEQAVEERSTSHFRGLISANYVDGRGRHKEEVIGAIRGYFLLNANIEVLNRVQDISLNGQDAATVVMNTALISQAQGRSLLGIDGDLYRLELELVREDSDWLVIGADWERTLQ